MCLFCSMKKGISKISLFRKVAIAEGISFLLLLFIAMPLKYLAKIPEPVLVGGWIHGVLFVAYGLLALELKMILEKPFKWLTKVMLAALLPFGPFIMDKELKKEEQAV
jgi:integral membrane protein